MISIPSTAPALLEKARDLLLNFNDATKASLTAFARPTTITSRVYIDDAIANEPVTNDVLKACHTLYASFIMNALQMQRLVTKDKSVKDLLRVVSNEALLAYEDVGAAFEAINTGKEFEGSDWDGQQKPKDTRSEQEKDDEWETQTIIEQERKKKGNSTSGKIIDLSGDGVTPVGKMIEITLSNPENKEASIKLNLIVQMLPFLIDSDLAHKLITLDAPPTFFQRVAALRAGELSFWHDFIAQLDLVKEKDKALAKDRSGHLHHYLEEQQKSRARLIHNILNDTDKRQRNLANTVLIVSKQAMTEAKVKTGVDFKNASQRQNFFANSFCMIVAVVDPLFNTVTMYFNGMDDYGTYSFEHFKSKGGKGDSSVDLINALTAFSKGNSPRF